MTGKQEIAQPGAIVAHYGNVAVGEPGDVVVSRAEQEQDPPQWVIIGVKLPFGRVGVLASDQLTQAALLREQELVKRKMPGRIPDAKILLEHTTLTLRFDRFNMIVADTYAQAMQSLAGIWQPPEVSDDGPPAISS